MPEYQLLYLQISHGLPLTRLRGDDEKAFANALSISYFLIALVQNALKIYTGPYKNESPDLIVGYNRGYRASWETAVGQVTDKIFHDNTKAWSGDHCIDHSLVPGVLFCNRPIATEQARLMDIGPTVLDMFGVDVPKYMDGKPLAVADAKGS